MGGQTKGPKNMWKKIMVVAGGTALAVALPFAALAITTDEFPDVLMPAHALTDTVQATTQVQAADEIAPVEPTGPWVSPVAVDPIGVEQAEQTMVRQQLRVHAETGPPEGFEPIQQRLHVDDPLGLGPASGNAGQGQNMGYGNQNAPMAGPGTGDPADCPYDEQPQGGQGAGNAGMGGRSG